MPDISEIPYRINAPIDIARFAHPSRSHVFPVSNFGFVKTTCATLSKDEQKKSELVWVPVETQNSFKRRMDNGAPIQPPPPKVPKKKRTRDGPTSLRVNRPLRQSNGEPMSVPEDIWLMIFDRMHPRDLLSMRNVCTFFRRRLDRLDTTFLNARISTFGEDSPGPLPGMTEKQLAELTVGRGCMIRGCVRSNTVKTYWAYGLRMCMECLASETIELFDARNLMLLSRDKHFLLDLIIGAQFSSGKYQKMQCFNEARNEWNQPPTTKTVFMKTDVANVLAEHDSQPSDRRDGWTAKKREKASAQRSAITKLEKWSAIPRDVIPHHRNARREFFSQKALELNPRITEDMLQRMIPFRNALSSNRPPTAAAWDILKPKLLEARPDVNRILDIEKQEFVSDGIEHYTLLSQHRYGQRSLEQLVVKDFGKMAILEVEANVAADADLVLLVLNHVYDTFEARQRIDPVYGLRKDGSRGPYKLLLDDALMIISEVIEPFVERWLDRERSRTALGSFRCPGCPRRDCKTKYKFEELFQHIYQKHAGLAGNGEKYFTLKAPYPLRHSAHKFPYNSVEWPKCLPILPLHHNAQRDIKWDPAYRPTYVEASPINTISAFEGRQLLPSQYAANDFAGNVLHAAQTMHSSTIRLDSKTKIAIQYALDRFRQCDSSGEISLDLLRQTFRNLSINNGTRLTFKVRCLSCVRGQDDNKYARTPQSFHNLVEHFDRKHADVQIRGGNWTTDLFDLPSGTQVRDSMLEADRELEAKKDATRKKLAKQGKVPRKKPVAKADEILTTPSAAFLFSKLYANTHPIDPAIAMTADQRTHLFPS